MRIILAVLVVGLLAAPAFAQDLGTCPDYEGITCDGWVTDAAGALNAEPSVEAAAARFVAEHGGFGGGGFSGGGSGGSGW